MHTWRLIKRAAVFVPTVPNMRHTKKHLGIAGKTTAQSPATALSLIWIGTTEQMAAHNRTKRRKNNIRVSAQNKKYSEFCSSIPPLPTTNQISQSNLHKNDEVSHFWIAHFTRAIFFRYEIRPLHSVGRKLSGRFGLAKLAPRVTWGHV